MQISGLRQGAPYPMFGRTSATASDAFSQMLDAGGRSGADRSAAPEPKDSISFSSRSSAPDFTNMTPKDFITEAKAMYDRGEIDLDQIFKMQRAAGAISEETRNAIMDGGSSTPMNFVAIFQEQASLGTQYQAAYGAQKALDILHLISR